MQLLRVLLLVGAVGAAADQAEVNPLAKVFQLIGDLRGKIVADGEQEMKAFKEYAQWCGSTAASVSNEIETSTALGNKLSAKVTELASDIEVGDTKVGDLSEAISKAESELKGATAIREKEAEEFGEAEKELMATVDTLERAVSVLEKQLSAGGSFAQIDTSSLSTLLQSLSAITDAAGLDGGSQQKLLALVQARDEDGDAELGAPKAAAYSGQSGGIMDVLEDMKDKAQGQLADLRKSETQARNSYSLLRQSLTDEVSATTKELNDQKSAKAEAGEEKASSEGNLEVATKETATSEKKNENVRADCQNVAADHEANVAARVAELKTIDEAEKILKETTGGAETKQYSFLQMSAASGSTQRARSMASSAVIAAVQQLAKQQHSAAIAALASRIGAVLKYGQKGGGDPFEKVKGLIDSMIMKLEKEAGEEATEKAYCDEEMSKTKAKKEELDDTVSQLSAKIEKAASKSAGLKQEVSELMNELSALTKETAEMDSMRRDENAVYTASKKDLELGLGGVRKALSVLREFYAAPKAALIQTDDDDEEQMSSLMQQAASQPAVPEKAEKSTGAGGGIIGLLEVIESDFAKNLATEDAAESDAQSAYDKQTQSNKITTAQKEQDSKFKTQEFKSLDKSIAELEADKATEVQEQTAVNEYYSKIKERCIAKPSSYEERKQRRDAEIAGLKDALSSLESAAFLEVGSRSRRSRSLRGDTLRAM